MSAFDTSPFNSALFGGVAAAGYVPRQVGHGLLYPALRKAGVTIGPGRTPSPAQFQDAIDELNRLAGMLNCDRMFIYSIARQEFPLVNGQTSYTIGIPADPYAAVDFAAERPQLIESAAIMYGGNTGTPLAVLTDPEWAKISANLAAGYASGYCASGIYNDRAFPVSTLYLTWPPLDGQTLVLFAWQRVPYFLTITDQVLLPLQYEDCLVLNLAVRLAPHFQRDVRPDVMQQARESLMHLRSINAPQPVLEIPWLCRWNLHGGAFVTLPGSGGGSGSGVAGPPGPQGPAGPPGPSANLVWAEIPTPPADGSTATFTLAHTPAGAVTLFVAGVEQRPLVDYTQSGAAVTFTVPPKAGDAIVANYNY